MHSQSIRIFLVAVVFVALQGLAPAQGNGLGAELRVLNEAQAKAFGGISAAGVGIDSVLPGSLADYLDLKAGDVILEVNGCAATSADKVKLATRPKSEGNYVIYARQGVKRSIYVAPTSSMKVLFVLPPDTIADSDNEFKGIGKSTGLSMVFSPTIPGQLGDYAAVVLLNPKVCRPGVADQLKAYLKHGGGVVMAEMIPVLLVDNNQAITQDNFNIDAISDWFGASILLTTKSCTARTISDPFTMEGHYDRDDRLSISMNHPMLSDIGNGDSVFGYRSRLRYLGCPEEKLSDATTPVAWWENAVYDDKRVAGAIYNCYGRGRVYWQFEATEPSYPQVQELLIAGIRWAAGAAGAATAGGN